jgi:hypothetical protein
MALISPNLILLGNRESLISAIDRAGKVRLPSRYDAHDLWFEYKPLSTDVRYLRINFALNQGVLLSASYKVSSPEFGQQLYSKAKLNELISEQTGDAVDVKAQLTREDAQLKAGQWRALLEHMPAAAPPAQKGSQKIRIFGLEGGPKEITLPRPK